MAHPITRTVEWGDFKRGLLARIDELHMQLEEPALEARTADIIRGRIMEIRETLSRAEPAFVAPVSVTSEPGTGY